MGTMIASAPRSSALPITAWSFQGTRTSPALPPRATAWSTGASVPSSIVPCCMSTITWSKPTDAISSANSVSGVLTQLPIDGSPASSAARNGFR
jgi:hypothetical protein